MSSVVPGDLIVNKLILVNSNGQLDLTNTFISASIYESIFTPGIVCDIVVLDSIDQLGRLKLSGGETIFFNIQTPGGDISSYTFSLNKLSNLISKGSQKSKQYTLECVSEEALMDKVNFVQKSYSALCSEMIVDIHNNYLNSKKPIDVEDTKSAQIIIIPNKNPYDAIRLIKNRSVSVTNKSSSYVYFETMKDNKQTFIFKTIEQLFQANTVKQFQQSDAINHSYKEKNDNNILAYKITNQFSAIDKIGYGAPTKLTTFNFTTQQFDTDIINVSDTLFSDGGGNTTSISVDLSNRFYNTKIPPQSYQPVDISQRPTTFIPGVAPSLSSYIGSIIQNAIKIKVYGDTSLFAGCMVNCVFPNKNGLTGPATVDPLLSGKFLITRLHHKIGKITDSPRYTVVAEIIKGKYNIGVG